MRYTGKTVVKLDAVEGHEEEFAAYALEFIDVFAPLANEEWLHGMTWLFGWDSSLRPEVEDEIRRGTFRGREEDDDGEGTARETAEVVGLFCGGLAAAVPAISFEATVYLMRSDDYGGRVTYASGADSTVCVTDTVLYEDRFESECIFDWEGIETEYEIRHDEDSGLLIELARRWFERYPWSIEERSVVVMHWDGSEYVVDEVSGEPPAGLY